MQGCSRRLRLAGSAALLALGILASGGATPARAGGLAALDDRDRALFCALGGDRYRPNRAWPTRPELREAEALLEDVDRELCMARFREALALAERGRVHLASLPPSWGLRARRARLEALAATGAIALGDEEAGEKHFARALELDPGLELDASRVSPRLLRVWDRVRARRVAAR